MSSVDKTLNRNLAQGMSITDVSILLGSMAVTNKLTNVYIIPKMYKMGYLANPYIMAGVKIGAGYLTAVNVKNQVVKLAGLGLAGSGVQDLVNRAGSVVESNFQPARSNTKSQEDLNKIF